MNTETAIPDLRDTPLDQITAPTGSPLAHAIELYRKRLKDNELPLSSFNAKI